jgi:tRNA uridine 5-carboxymethylaminomethyl modification enzyme
MAVMVDDLTLHGVSEPYRMLTARAEYRLRLRANNATTRLTPLAIEAGCVGTERREWFARRETVRSQWDSALEMEIVASRLVSGGLPVREHGKRTIRDWLRFGGVELADLAAFLPDGLDPGSEMASELAEDAAYAPYLARQDAELRDLRASNAVPLGERFPFAEVPGLSREMIERLESGRPANLSAAGRIPGITPAALAALLVYARRIGQAA